MNKIQYAVLYTSFLLIANVLSANETKFGELNNLKFGDMKKMALSNNVFSAPNTVFFDQDGKEITLKQFQGRVTLVNFWATWCAPCREEMPSLSNLQKLKDEKNFNYDIEVDGGINFSNSKDVINAGANILVSGTTIFKENNGNIKKNIETLKEVSVSYTHLTLPTKRIV